MNTPQKAFIEHLKNIAPLHKDDVDAIVAMSSVKTLKANNLWFHTEMIAQHVAFVYKGYLRKYFIADGSEKTDYFYFENSFTGDMPSILEQKPCRSYNIAMEETTLVTLPYAQLNDLASKSHNAEHLLRTFAEQGFIHYYNKASDFLLLSPKERYEKLIHEFPQILKKATQYHIASYLGITPQHLSRIRHLV